MKNRTSKLFAVAALCGLVSSTAHAVNVDLELALLVDVSGSVDATEYNLQKQGYVQAFQDPGVQSAIASLSGGGVAVTFVEWSGAAEQAQLVGWTLVNDATSANAFASAINSVSRSFSGSTGPGSAINYITPKFGPEAGGAVDNGFTSVRQVIDVSGDGAQNVGDPTLTARNNALAAGIDKINGLPILGEPGLLAWYQNNIQGGVGAFTLPAASFADFANAVKTKITAEIRNQNPVPDAGPGLVLASLLIGGILRTGRKS